MLIVVMLLLCGAGTQAELAACVTFPLASIASGIAHGDRSVAQCHQ